MNNLPVIDIHGMTRKDAIQVLRINLKHFHNQGFHEELCTATVRVFLDLMLEHFLRKFIMLKTSNPQVMMELLLQSFKKGVLGDLSPNKTINFINNSNLHHSNKR